jgi:hypothetical protein
LKSWKKEKEKMMDRSDSSDFASILTNDPFKENFERK